jgi:hypothetical protein
MTLMATARRALLLALLLGLASACSDDAAPRDAAQPVREGLAPDVAPAGPRPIGSPCAKDAECEHNRCLIQRGAGVFPGGYCSKACDVITAPCPAGASCAGTVDGDCFKICASQGDCRAGYTCKEGPGGLPMICFP